MVVCAAQQSHHGAIPGPSGRLQVTSEGVLPDRAALAASDEDERKVVPLRRSDQAIVQGLVSREPWAANALYDRYAPAIERMLRRTLGYERHADFEDLLHEVFVQALASAHTLADSTALLAWLQTIAARIGFRTMRRRRALGWLRFREPEFVPEVEVEDAPLEVRQACQTFYRLLEKLPPEERMAFQLRYVEGMEVAHVATTLGYSLSTTKRRLSSAEDRFAKLARREPSLAPFLERGDRWQG